MKNWSRLILPVGLGVLAMVINASAMTSRLKPVQLVGVNRLIMPGEKFSRDALVMVEVGYPSSHLKAHFWLWHERETLLGEVGALARLESGDLVPRSVYRGYGRSAFSISENQVELGVRFHESAMKSDGRHLLLPGRNVRLVFRDGGELPVALITNLEPVVEPESKGVRGRFYQMRVLLPRTDDGTIARMISSEVNQVVGLSDAAAVPRTLLSRN